VIELIEDGSVVLVLNTPSGGTARADGYAIRAAATSVDTPIITTLQEFQAAVQAIEALPEDPFTVRSLQEHQEYLREEVGA
jgi:carbamoyl-phosphate synthase large subunit